MKAKAYILFAMAALLLSACAGQEAEQVTYFPAKKATGINPDTHLVLTFAQEPQLGTEGFIRIWDARSGECVDSLDMSLPAGLTRSRTYGPECDYTKVPYDYSRDFVPTNRNTVPGTPSGTAEPTPRDMQLTIIGGFTDGFRFYPVIIHGNTAYVNRRLTVLAAIGEAVEGLRGTRLGIRQGVVFSTDFFIAPHRPVIHGQGQGLEIHSRAAH